MRQKKVCLLHFIVVIKEKPGINIKKEFMALNTFSKLID